MNLRDPEIYLFATTSNIGRFQITFTSHNNPPPPYSMTYRSILPTKWFPWILSNLCCIEISELCWNIHTRFGTECNDNRVIIV